MSFSQLLSILLARRRILTWVFLVTVAVTAVVSFLLPKTYTAVASLVIDSKGADPITGIMMPATLLPGYMATQVDIIQSQNVALKVVDKLGVTNNPLAKIQFEKATKGEGDIRYWYADLFLKNLDVKPSRLSSVIEISYQGADPKFAAAMANAFAEEYINTNLQLKTDPAKRAAVWFDQQIKGLRQNVEKAQEKLSGYQKEHGIAFAGERLDTEATRLSELSSQLVIAQAQTYDSTSRHSQLKKSVASESPEILSNSLIQGLKSQLAQAESRFSDVSQRLDINHPQYQAALAEVNNLRTMISAEIAKTSSGVGQTALVSQQKEGEIRTALAAQKDRVLKLKDQQDEMAVLTREVESAQRVYDLALQRFGQTNMEGKSSQTDVSILNPAVPPVKQSGPKILLNIVLSVFLGMLLGIGFAMTAELLDRRVRSVEDLIQFLGLPVLVELNLLELNRKSKKASGFISQLRQRFKEKQANKHIVSKYQFFAK